MMFIKSDCPNNNDKETLTMTLSVGNVLAKAASSKIGVFWASAACLAMFITLSQVTIAAEDPISLDFADFKSIENGGVEIRLSLSGKPGKPTDFTSKNPAKISLDIPNATNNLPWSLPLPIEVGGVNTVKAKQAKGRTRVEISMDKLSNYKVRTEGNNILIAIGKNVKGSASKPKPVAKAKPRSQPPSRPSRRSGGSGAKLKNVKFSSLPGDKVQIKLTFSGPATTPGSFTIDNPARIALDFPGVTSALDWKSKNIGIGFAKSVTAVEAGNRTRVILNLVQLIPFETEVAGNSVYVTLASARTASDSGITAAASKRISTAVPGDDTVHSITNVDFRRGNNGEGRVVVTLSDPNTPASTGESGQEIFVDFGNTGLPDNLQQRLDVIDFATPVRFVDTSRVGNRVRLAITPQGEYEYLAYHSGNTYTIEVKPAVVKKDDGGKIDDAGFKGEKLSLNFQDIEVRAVLQLIADFTDLNMVTSDSVRGNLTLRLKNVPWDQALDIVLKTKGLAMRRTGSVILVAPSEEIAAREKLELEAKKQLEKLEPLHSELIQINYAKATEIATLIKSKGTAVMSERGSSAVDKRTNTLLAVDTAERLVAIRKLIGKLDIPVRQVLIDSRIVIADNSFAKDLGVRFGVSAVSNKATLSTTSGSLEGTTTVVDQGVTNGTPIPPSVVPGSQNDRLNVNLPATPKTGGSPGSIALAILSANSLLDLELSALQSDGRGEVISNPRVVTSNQQEALIQQGTEIPYQEATSSGATSVSFKEAVLQLRVTPQITPDDRVFLDLQVNKDNANPTTSGIPSIDTKEVKTQVLVNNGETVVLGGVYEQESKQIISRVPFFGDLPLIGVLFRSSQKSDVKSELLIFVTPKILKQSLSASTQ